MKRNVLRSVSLLLTISLFLSFQSCEFFGGTIERADLIGTWEVNDVSVHMRVGGIDITQVMVLTFGYTQEEADLKLDSISNEMIGEMDGSIEFKEDGSYSVSFTDDDPEIGTWELDVEAETISLTETGSTSVEILSVESLTSSECILLLPSEEDEIDLDNDGDSESSVSIDIEIILDKI